ncbi:hypothetical protein FRB90_011318 [Tulasnella sp. 427]|nr:hypothetical protein FRB90_011318 [Tulasnella sp. 427]
MNHEMMLWPDMSTYNSSEDSFQFIYENFEPTWEVTTEAIEGQLLQPTAIYNNPTPSPNTKSLNPDWYDQNQTSSNSTDLHADSSDDEDPLGACTQAIGGYYSKTLGPQPIPQGWEEHFISYQGHNHLIKQKGNLELDLYRNYHGEEFKWNDIKIYFKDVVINPQERSIKIYVDDDIEGLISLTSDSFWCRQCGHPHEKAQPLEDDDIQIPLPTSAPPATPQITRKEFRDRIYTIQECLDLANLNPKTVTKKTLKFSLPKLPIDADLDSIPIRPPNHLVHKICCDVIVIDRLFDTDLPEFWRFINDKANVDNLKYYAWSFEESDPIYDYLVTLAWTNEYNVSLALHNKRVAQEGWPAKKSEEEYHQDCLNAIDFAAGNNTLGIYPPSSSIIPDISLDSSSIDIDIPESSSSSSSSSNNHDYAFYSNQGVSYHFPSTPERVDIRNYNNNFHVAIANPDNTIRPLQPAEYSKFFSTYSFAPPDHSTSSATPSYYSALSPTPSISSSDRDLNLIHQIFGNPDEIDELSE